MPAKSQKSITIRLDLWNEVIEHLDADRVKYLGVGVRSYTGLVNYILESYLKEDVVGLGDVAVRLDRIERLLEGIGKR